jgi:hypothetical protein
MYAEEAVGPPAVGHVNPLLEGNGRVRLTTQADLHSPVLPEQDGTQANGNIQRQVLLVTPVRHSAGIGTAVSGIDEDADHLPSPCNTF